MCGRIALALDELASPVRQSNDFTQNVYPYKSNILFIIRPVGSNNRLGGTHYRLGGAHIIFFFFFLFFFFLGGGIFVQIIGGGTAPLCPPIPTALIIYFYNNYLILCSLCIVFL